MRSSRSTKALCYIPSFYQYHAFPSLLQGERRGAAATALLQEPHPRLLSMTRIGVDSMLAWSKTSTIEHGIREPAFICNFQGLILDPCFSTVLENT
jgi:hypothetical protein